MGGCSTAIVEKPSSLPVFLYVIDFVIISFSPCDDLAAPSWWILPIIWDAWERWSQKIKGDYLLALLWSIEPWSDDSLIEWIGNKYGLLNLSSVDGSKLGEK